MGPVPTESIEVFVNRAVIIKDCRCYRCWNASGFVDVKATRRDDLWCIRIDPLSWSFFNRLGTSSGSTVNGSRVLLFWWSASGLHRVLQMRIVVSVFDWCQATDWSEFDQLMSDRVDYIWIPCPEGRAVSNSQAFSPYEALRESSVKFNLDADLQCAWHQWQHSAI